MRHFRVSRGQEVLIHVWDRMVTFHDGYLVVVRMNVSPGKSVLRQISTASEEFEGSNMEKDILATVLDIEKEIELQLESERSKAGQWLDSTRREIEEDFAAKVRGLEDSLLEAIDIAKESAEKQAAAILAKAVEQTRLLSEISDETLKRFITEHLDRILPGSGHDSQDVQS